MKLKAETLYSELVLHFIIYCGMFCSASCWIRTSDTYQHTPSWILKTAATDTAAADDDEDDDDDIIGDNEEKGGQNAWPLCL